MGYFSTPLTVRPLIDEDAVRISVRASDVRVDEWTVLRADVESVLSGYEDDFTGWRGVGEVRVRMGRSGGDVAFYDGNDRALLRLGVSEVSSFLAHLRAALFELGGEPSAPTPRTASTQPPTTPVLSASSAAAASAADIESMRGVLQQIMMAVITLTSDVNRMMRQLAEREAERVVQPQVVIMPAPAAVPQVMQVEVPAARVAGPEESEMFIPPMRPSEISGAALEASEKSGDGDELAAAAAALKAAKKRRTKKKEG